ncbi:XrtA/PEP-CTERM system histidine kinase PrsK [Colwellia sp. RSH04]|uniref:XrtA/PEP-CTERM system histidine kinase PrsK n=1 Tax=Colwellia sp. RSH04 TaxID=2305464 RepID=UPI000E5736BE|nr:XrtA/PEP-CTERM system histidine kinase PrsK [Colwellia sp. RSH04]RHW76449.1 PEP-CTERM system histidine kinase PrsK [Colwellia sp. RSH04]
MEVIGSTGFLISAFAYFIFILLILAARNHTLTGKLLFISSTLLFASSLTAALQSKQGFSLMVVLSLETFKVMTWSVLIICTQNNISTVRKLFADHHIQKYLIVSISLSIACWLMTFIASNGGKYLFSLFLLLNLWLLVLLEQLYRNADVKAKWALWSLIIGLGIITVFDFVLFAQAAMVNQLDFSYWYARGYIATIAMPLILISTRRIKDWSVNVFVSREVVFYSSMLLISGLYLLLLAVAGYLINYFGGAWGDVISIAFVILGGTVLAALLMTEKLRREVKVFITKHFFANKYDYRIEWLKSIEKLEIGTPDDHYHTATHIICSSLNIKKAALIKKQSEGNYQCMYQQNLPIDKGHLTELTGVDIFCQQQGWIIDVREFASIEQSYPELTLDVEFCRTQHIDIIVPIFTGKTLYGFFLLALPAEQGLLNWEDRDLLFALSKQLSNYVSLNEANESLAESKQFEAFHRMSAFLIHDLKNVQAQLGLISSNAKRHRDNPAFIDDVFETIESATSRLDKVLDQLRNKQVLESKEESINVSEVIKQVVAQRNIQLPTIQVIIESEVSLMIERETFASVLNHLLQNAQEATNDQGWVKISSTEVNNSLVIVIQDNGSGMTEEFIKQRLFKPFDTTKGNAGMGIGVYEAKQFIESVGGTIKVNSFENEGSLFEITIPCRNEHSLVKI